MLTDFDSVMRTNCAKPAPCGSLFLMLMTGQDLDEGDANGTKLYNEYKRGELLIHGQDTYRKIKSDLKAMNEILNNTKESEHAPPRSSSSVKSPMEQYLTPLSDEETQASYQSWINPIES